jgi:hypothetical protein
MASGSWGCGARGWRREGLESDVTRVKKQVDVGVGFGCGVGFGGVVGVGFVGVAGTALVDGTYADFFGDAAARVGTALGGENFAVTLEGRDYVPLPRTRGWGITAARPCINNKK